VSKVFWRQFMRRALVAGTVVPAPALIAVGIGTASSPAGAAGQGLTCTGISGKAQKVVTFSGCKPTAKTGGTATATRLASDTSLTLHWSNGLRTSFTVKYRVAGKNQNPCPMPKLEYLGKGKVTADTTGTTSPGAAVKLSVCINPSTGKTFPLAGKTTVDIAP
jgi:hypothetical protein